MRTNWKKLLALLAVAALLAIGVAAVAETVDETAPAQTQTDEDAAYEEALTRYYAARQQTCLNDFRTELAQMVENGQLTQEQADLLTERMEAQISVANGVCPECGASLPTYGRGNKTFGRGKGGRRG